MCFTSNLRGFVLGSENPKLLEKFESHGIIVAYNDIHG